MRVRIPIWVEIYSDDGPDEALVKLAAVKEIMRYSDGRRAPFIEALEGLFPVDGILKQALESPHRERYGNETVPTKHGHEAKAVRLARKELEAIRFYVRVLDDQTL